MKSYFVLWNGDESGMSRETREDLISITERGDVADGNWSFGKGLGDPAAGDRVYMLRTGKLRGVIGSGTLTYEGIVEGWRWDGSDRTAYYVDVAWDVMLDDDDRLPIEQIEGQLSGFKFPVLGSGRLIKDPADRELAKLWGEHLDNLRREPGRGWIGAGGPSRPPKSLYGSPVPLGKPNVRYDVESFASYTATQEEAELLQRFVDHLSGMSHQLTGYRIVPEVGAAPLFVDLLDLTDNVLYEAKASTSREAVRMALGQLLDYRRHLSPRPTMSMLLPDEPSQDLLDLLAENRVTCVYENPDGGFTFAE